jgi:hypothetical protein
LLRKELRQASERRRYCISTIEIREAIWAKKRKELRLHRTQLLSMEGTNGMPLHKRV